MAVRVGRGGSRYFYNKHCVVKDDSNGDWGWIQQSDMDSWVGGLAAPDAFRAAQAWIEAHDDKNSQ